MRDINFFFIRIHVPPATCLLASTQHFFCESGVIVQTNKINIALYITFKCIVSMVLDTIIIGGGITGLYCARELLSSGVHNICILEAKGRLGGRIKTVKTKLKHAHSELLYDVGAIRLKTTHRISLQLVHQLGLQNDLKPYNYVKKYFVNSKLEHSNREVPQVLQLLKKSTVATRESNTVKALLYLWGKEALHYPCLAKFGYSRNMDNQSAEAFWQQSKNYTETARYVHLDHGLSSVVERLARGIGRRKIHLNTTVHNWKWNDYHNFFTVYTSTGTLRCKRLIVTIPQVNLLRVPYMQSYNFQLHSVDSSSSVRFLAKYPCDASGKYWYGDTQEIVTDLPIRNIKILRPKTGFVQISYCHGMNADMINYFQHSKKAYKYVEQQLKQIFPEADIPKPTFCKVHYWTDARTLWKPNVHISDVIEQMRQPDTRVPMFLTGDSFCMSQGWIEGSLSHCQQTLSLYHAARVSSLTEQFYLPLYTRAEVALHNTVKDAWVIYKNHVFDITQFIPKHPGSKFIEQMPGKDLTFVYNSVGHSTNSLNILNKYLIGQLQTE